MKILTKTFIRYFTFVCLIILFSCESQKKPNKKNTSRSIGTINKLNKWNINSVCECYDEAFSRLEIASKIRDLYKSFDEYNENKVDVKKVKAKTKEFRSIQNYCLQTYKRAMFENNCDPKDKLKSIQNDLFESGIQVSKY